MALSFALVKNVNFGAQTPKMRQAIWDVTLDGSYVNPGGWTLTAANFAMNRVTLLDPDFMNAGYFFGWDQANNKLKAYWCSGGGAATECPTNQGGLNALVLRVQVIGS